MKILTFIKLLCRPTYEIAYAPEPKDSCLNPIDHYRVVGYPTGNSFRTKSGNVCFRARVENRENAFRTFRVDRVVSIRRVFA